MTVEEEIESRKTWTVEVRLYNLLHPKMHTFRHLTSYDDAVWIAKYYRLIKRAEVRIVEESIKHA